MYTQRIHLNDFAELLIFFTPNLHFRVLNCPVKYYHPLNGLAQNKYGTGIHCPNSLILTSSIHG